MVDWGHEIPMSRDSRELTEDYTELAQLRDENPCLVAEVSRLRAALAVYADESNWRHETMSLAPWEHKPTLWKEDVWKGPGDGPDVARRALAGEAPDA